MRRVELGAELGKLQAERDQKIPLLRTVLEKAEQAVVAAKATFDSALIRVNGARGSLTSAGASALRAIERLEAQLRRPADPLDRCVY